MVTSPFKLSVKRQDAAWQLQTLPPQWKITEYIGPSDYGGAPILDRSNYEDIMKQLRALTKDGEGPVEGNPTGYPDYGFEPENTDWFECDGRIVWKCLISPEEYKEAKKRGSYFDERGHYRGYESDEGGYQNLALDLLGPSDYEHKEPVLDCLLEINHYLSDYPVLDEVDFSDREYKAECESIADSLPSGCPELTETQVGKVHLFLTQYSWPTPDPNEQGCAAEHQVDWAGDDYHVNGGGDLDSSVKYALRKLGIWPHYRARRRRG